VSGFSRTVEVFMLTRREFGKLAMIAPLVRLKPDTTYEATLEGAGVDSSVNGVHLGVQTYSFRDLPRPAGAADSVDVVIKAMKESGVSECELFAPQLEPQFPQGARGQRGAPPSPEAIKAREDLRKWRLESPLDHFRNAKKRFDAAGITIFAYCYNMNDSFTDAEIDRGFEMTKALGTNIMTTSTQMTVAKRIAPLADKHRIVVGLHGHSNISDPNEFATPESFAAAMKMSKYFKVNLDVGHFTAANYDAVAYIREHHANITNLHLKDRKKDQGANVPWGQGDTPIKQVLQLLREKKYDIPANIEYEYQGADTVAEIAKCYQFCKDALA
jgi:sugar phosphate isomerase/epimerase